MNYYLIFYLIILSRTPLLLNGSGFCDNKTETERIFFMSNQNYIIKTGEVYRQEVGKPFAGTVGKAYSVYFKYDFQRVFSGFVMTAIPSCVTPSGSSSSRCQDLPKCLNIGFIIGDKSGFVEQAYVAYRSEQIGGIPALNPISDQNELPFNLKVENEIQKPFWPLTASKDVRYLDSAFIENGFLLIHLILQRGVVYLHWSSMEEENWPNHWTATDSITANPPIDLYFGFFLFDNQSTYAIVKSAGSDQRIVKYENKTDFVSEDNLTLIEDLYNCKTLTTTPTTTISLSTGISSMSTTQTVIVSNITIGTNMTTILLPTSQISVTPTTVESDQSPKSDGLGVLFWIFLFVILIVIICAIGFGYYYLKIRKLDKTSKTSEATKRSDNDDPQPVAAQSQATDPINK